MSDSVAVPGVKRTPASSIGLIITGLLSAPCFIGVLLIPVGLGAVMTSAAFKFFDAWRYLFMGLSVALLVVAHIGLRKADVFRPTLLVWIATVVAVALILGEVIVDPPWDRHANIPGM